MSAKASSRKKKSSHGSDRSNTRGAVAKAAAVAAQIAVDPAVEPAVPVADPSVEGADPSTEEATVAVHETPPASLLAQVAQEAAVVEPAVAIAAEEPAAAAEPLVSVEPALDAAAVADAGSGSVLSAHPSASPKHTEAADAPLTVFGNAGLASPVEASGAQALQSIRRALPSREQAAAALRFVTLRQSLLSALDLLLPTQGAILDVGCGAGLLSAYFTQTAPTRAITGIDSQPTQIQRAERLARDLGLTQNRYIVGDARTVDLPTGFAAIYAVDALHRLPPHAQEDLLARLVSLLQPGGSLIITERTTDSLLGARLTELVDRTLQKTVGSVLGDRSLQTAPLPSFHRQPNDWLVLLRRLGLRARAGLLPDLLQPHVLLTASLA